MLTETLDNLSTLLNIDNAILPNIITFIVVVVIIMLSVKGALELKSIVLIYGLVMGILAILGIESVFNIFTLIETVIEWVIESIFLRVAIYGY